MHFRGGRGLETLFCGWAVEKNIANDFLVDAKIQLNFKFSFEADNALNLAGEIATKPTNIAQKSIVREICLVTLCQLDGDLKPLFQMQMQLCELCADGRIVFFGQVLLLTRSRQAKYVNTTRFAVVALEKRKQYGRRTITIAFEACLLVDRHLEHLSSRGLTKKLQRVFSTT